MTSPLPEENAHKALLRRSFAVSYSLTDFTTDERSLLHRHGTWLNALERGEISPTTPEQVKFLLVARGEKPPVTPHEKLWLKYCQARSKQTERLRTLIYGGLLSFEQLKNIQINESDFTFSEQEHTELTRQLDTASSKRSAWRGGGFIVYARTDGQD